MDGMVADDGAVCVIADLSSCPFVKGRSGAEVARREGWSLGHRSGPGGLGFVFHKCYCRLDTSESSCLMMSCLEHLQVIFTSLRSIDRLDFVVCKLLGHLLFSRC
jgi:hypothetical protein